MENSAPAIVSRETFRLAQELRARRQAGLELSETPSSSVFSGRIFCGRCGSTFRRKKISGKTYWLCRRRDRGAEQCPVPQISEEKLAAACLRLWNKLTLHGPEFLRPLLNRLKELRERELRSNQKLSDIDKEIAHLSEQNLVLIRLQSNGYIDCRRGNPDRIDGESGQKKSGIPLSCPAYLGAAANTASYFKCCRPARRGSPVAKKVTFPYNKKALAGGVLQAQEFYLCFHREDTIKSSR